MFSSAGMKEAIRSFPWENTTLGPEPSWPTNLRVILNVMLGSRFPMMLWWGEDKIQIYNDASAELIGERYHPSSLGQRAADFWDQSWSMFEPQIEQVASGQGSVFQEDQRLVINRNGVMEETFWTYSFCPVQGETKVDGVLSIGTEVTQQHYHAERARELSAGLLDLFKNSANFVCLHRGPNHVYQFVNEHYKELMGNRDFIGRPAVEVVPEIAGQGFFELLDKVFCTGEPFISPAIPMRYCPTPDSPMIEVMLQLSYQPLVAPGGKIFGVFVEGRQVEPSICPNADEETCPAVDPQLSVRETEVLRWTAAGKTAAEIAQILNISGRTVEFHINSAARKLDTVNRVQTVVEAIRKKLLPL